MGSGEASANAARGNATVGDQCGDAVHRARRNHTLGLSLGRIPHVERYRGLVPAEEALGFDNEDLLPPTAIFSRTSTSTNTS